MVENVIRLQPDDKVIEILIKQTEAIERLCDLLEARPSDSQMMDTDEAARYLGIKKQTLYEYSSKNQIPKYKIGKKCLYRKSDLDAYLAACAVRG